MELEPEMQQKEIWGHIVKAKKIIITEPDYNRLQRLIESSRRFRVRDMKHIDTLQEELERATIVEPNEVPDDMVTMNSCVEVRDLNYGRTAVYQIVFPKDADIAKNRISILAPIGTGLLGYQAGVTVEWPFPSGVRRLRILRVEHQPEAAGVAA